MPEVAAIRAFGTRLAARWRLILLSILVVALVAPFVSETKPLRYQSVYKLTVIDDPLLYHANLSILKVLDPGGTEAQGALLTSPRVLAKASNQSGISVADLRNMIDIVSPEPGYLTLTVTARDSASPAGFGRGLLGKEEQRVHRAADAVLQAYRSTRLQIEKRASRDRTRAVHLALREHLPAAHRRKYRRELSYLKVLDAGAFDPGVTAAKLSDNGPKMRRTVFLGVGVGILVGLAVSSILALVDDRLRRPDQAAQIAGAPFLGELGALSKDGLDPARPLAGLGSAEIAAVANVAPLAWQVLQSANARVVVLAAPDSSNDALGAALRLASILAIFGVNVAAVDARTPSGPGAPGFTDLVDGSSSLEEVAVTAVLPDIRRTGASGRLVFIDSGSAPRVPHVDDRALLQRTIDVVGADRDVVLVVVTEGLVQSDPQRMLDAVDGALLVARLDATSARKLALLREELAQRQVTVLGVTVIC
jgi:hypothetical protein